MKRVSTAGSGLVATGELAGCPGLPVQMLVLACVRQKEEAAAAAESRRRQETMPTYAFCVLQTFHRLCKTSESVRPLESWEGRRRGGDR